MEEQPKQPIQENLWWVIPGQLAGVRKPTAAVDDAPELCSQAYLMQNGSTFEEALQTVLAVNPDVELREAQVNFLKMLEDESVQDEVTASA